MITTDRAGAPATVLVIGGGVIGLCCAYSLRRRGHEVTLVDSGDLGQGASAGNGGWICPSLSGPVPAPGLLLHSLGWLLRPGSPLRIHATLEPSFAGWLLAFARHCNARAYGRGLEAVGEMALSAPERFRALVADGVQFERHELGVLMLFSSRALADAEMAELQWMANQGGAPPVLLEGAALQEAEPAVGRTRLTGVLAPGDCHVRPESLTEGLAAWLREHGVDLLPATSVTRLGLGGEAVQFAETEKGERLYADAFVLAAGVETGRLARQLRVRIPLRSGKGYSVTFPAASPALNHALYLSEAKVAISPYDGAVRVLGTMELGTESVAINPGRVEAMLRSSRRYLPELALEGEGVTWAGMRPMVPDGLPVIGKPTPDANIVIATAHAMLGVTLGPATGEMVAELLESRPAIQPPAALSPVRF
ncbi:MAG TPA: FAD-dependent oxidoreductase [Candidatus Dormibacteraeota bacterium]|nr:FAD-dependent oxidoreductase [Candidatus Dormibacteraeota bacterium]